MTRIVTCPWQNSSSHDDKLNPHVTSTSLFARVARRQSQALWSELGPSGGPSDRHGRPLDPPDSASPEKSFRWSSQIRQPGRVRSYEPRGSGMKLSHTAVRSDGWMRMHCRRRLGRHSTSGGQPGSKPRSLAARVASILDGTGWSPGFSRSFPPEGGTPTCQSKVDRSLV